MAYHVGTKVYDSPLNYSEFREVVIARAKSILEQQGIKKVCTDAIRDYWVNNPTEMDIKCAVDITVDETLYNENKF